MNEPCVAIELSVLLVLVGFDVAQDTYLSFQLLRLQWDEYPVLGCSP